MQAVCEYTCGHQLCDMCTVYLPWDVIYLVPVQEKLYDAARYASRHLLQGVASQIELHEARQVLKCVLSQVTVSQLKEKSSDTHVRSRGLTLLIPRKHSIARCSQRYF